MKNRILFLIIFTIVSIFVFAPVVDVFAASKYETIIDWHASTSVPDGFLGRILPISKSTTSIVFNLLENGKPVDFSQSAVRWYINDNLYRNEKNGMGISRIIVTVPAGSKMKIRVVIPDFQGEMIDKIINIPVVSPEAVIDAAFDISAAEKRNLVFKASPFFFNDKSFVFSWSVDGKEIVDLSETSDILNLDVPDNVPSEQTIAVSLSIFNYISVLEKADKLLKFKIK